MASIRFIGVFLTKFTAKFLIVTTVLALLTLYPLWTAIATGGLIYLAVVDLVTVEVALFGTATLSFIQSMWLIKVKYERHQQS